MDLHLVNKRLVDLYGKDFLDQPIYRVVWSDDQIEKRFSYFEDYISGTNVLIRRVQEVREVKKYNFIRPQYVLEKLFINKHNTEILDNSTLSPQNCTYEPMWCFGFEKDANTKKPKYDKPLRPIWRAIELIMISMQTPHKLTPSQMNDVELEKAKEDEKLMLEILEANIKSDSFHSSVQDGDTILLNDATQKPSIGSKRWAEQ